MNNSNSSAGEAYLGQLSSTILQGAQNKRAQKRQFKYQKQLAAMDFERNLDMWNRTNMYNSPAEQMKRLEAAGLNPMLVYGKGGVGSGNVAQTMPKYQSFDPPFGKPYMQLPNLLSVMSQFQDYKHRKAQTDLVKKETDLKEAMKLGVESDSWMKWAKKGYMSDLPHKTDTKKSELGYQMYRYQTEALEQGVEKMRKDNIMRQKELDLFNTLKITENRALNNVLQGFMQLWLKKSTPRANIVIKDM